MRKQMMMLAIMMVLVFNSIVVYAAEISIKINGSTITSNVSPFIKNGTTFVPIRFVSESLGAKVDWNSKTKTVTITKENIDKIVIDKPNIVKNTTFVPLRFVAEKLGCAVEWNSATKTVIIREKGYIEKEPIINTIESLGLEVKNAADYGDLFIDIRTKKNQLLDYGYQKIVFIDQSQLPFQVGRRIIYSIEPFNNNKSIRIIQNHPEELPNDDGMKFYFVSKKDKASRLRNPYVQFNKDLGNGKRSVEYSVTCASDIGFDRNYMDYKLNEAEYLLFKEDVTGIAIALKNPWR